MRVVLEISSGPHAGRKTWLGESTVIKVGRTEQADFVVPGDQRLSGMHFALDCQRGACRLRDLASSNGTLVNGQRVTEVVLEDGDRIVAGQTTFRVHVEGAAVRAPPSPLPPSVAATRPEGLPRRPGAALPPYEAGLADSDPAVRRAALLAAAWNRQKWLLDHCRTLSECIVPANLDGLWLLAVLGEPADLDRMLAAGRELALGPRRFEVLGAFGHPAVVELVLGGVAGPDPVSAAAAGAAFTKITGADIDSGRRVEILPADGSQPDEFEREFLDEVALPDPTLARDHWRQVHQRFAKGTRWCRGFDLSGSSEQSVLDKLDLPSRFEASLRGRFWGTWQGGPLELELVGRRNRP